MKRLSLFCLQCILFIESFGMPTGFPKNLPPAHGLNFEENILPMQNPVLQVSPVVSEIIPSLQYGDVNMAGELPIGGTIKVSGCFPVYGMVSVDGNVPSSGTATVAESFGNQVMDVITKCANQYFS